MKASDLDDVARNMKHLHDTTRRNGWFMPNFKSRICTRDFIEGVASARYWAPHVADEIVALDCVNPPPVEELIALFAAGVRQE